MGSNLIHYLCVSMALLSAVKLGEEPKTAAQTEDQDVQVVSMTAKKYAFSPSHYCWEFCWTMFCIVISHVPSTLTRIKL